MMERRLRRVEMQTDPTFDRVDIETNSIVPLDLVTVKVNAKSRIATWRYGRETAGATLPDGTRVPTDRDTQDALNRILNSLDRGLATEPITYKGVDGWVALSKVEITAIAGAVAAHVQACWADEKAAADQIDAATSIEEIKTILTNAGA